jgi:hypothetical protein
LVPGDLLEPPVSTGVTANLAKMAETVSQVDQVTKVLPVVMVATAALAATVDLVIAEPPVRLVQEVGQEQTVAPAAKVTQDPEVLQEQTVGMAGLAPLALQVPEGTLAPQVLVALKVCQVPRATRVAQEPRVLKETTAPEAQGGSLEPMAETASPVALEEMVLTARTAKTVLRTPSVSPWLASSSSSSTASASEPAVIWVIPTRFFQK